MPLAGTSSKAPKDAKPPGRDIRGFFGSSQGSVTPMKSSQHLNSQRPAQAVAGSSKKEAIDLLSDDDEPIVKKPVTSSNGLDKSASQSRLKSERVMDVDDDDPPPAPKPSAPPPPAKKKRALVISDSESEPEKLPPKKKKAVSPPRPSVSTSASKTASASASAPKASGVKSASAKASASASSSKVGPPKKKKKDDDYVHFEDTKSTSEDDDIDEEDRPSKSKAKSKAKPAPKKAAVKKEPEPESKKEGSKKSNYFAMKASKLAGPSAPGSKEIPDGDPNALNGLAFVFTGELSAFSREEAIDLAKRFGGRVVMQPSTRTDYVVLGRDAGPAKLAAIKKHNLRTLDEDGFLNLIATREGVVDEKTAKKQQKAQKEIEQAARDLEAREKQAIKEAKKATASGATNVPDIKSQLWTTRYAPQSVKEICGNKGQVEKLLLWLEEWSASLKYGFRKPGKNGMNMFRAVLITGPPGIGKTTSAHLCAKLAGYTPIELNASDARSKKLVENSTNIMNTSLDGWMGSGKATNAVGVEISNKSCLIMDEVDGMSAGDRGGVGALSALIKKSKVPIICIANDRQAQKLKPIVNNTFNLSFRKPEVNAIRSRMMSIAFKEKMKIPANVIDQLVNGAQSDIRQVLNMLSTWRLSSDSMDFDEGKNLAKLNEKYSVMTPFNVTNKVLGPYLFSPTARETLSEKMELYFHDHSFVPMFIQENYLKTVPAKSRNLDGPEKILKDLSLMEKAAASLSDGDLVDAMIHGPDQHWSLMPLHAVCSTVRPASFIYGQGAGYAGPTAMSFPQWFGQNSKQNKLTRQLADVQIRMRLKVSGNKPEIRQSYVPALFPHIVQPLLDQGASAVDEIIERMDQYYLSREDWDTVVELGVGDQKEDLVTKKISTATKTAFTKKYNSADHPIPFHKQDMGKAPKKLSGGPAPDLDDVLDAVDEQIDDAEEKHEDVDDVGKDKLIKQAKGKGKAAPAKSKGKAKEK